jgi:hypothetical protein
LRRVDDDVGDADKLFFYRAVIIFAFFRAMSISHFLNRLLWLFSQALKDCLLQGRCCFPLLAALFRRFRSAGFYVPPWAGPFRK